MSQIALTVSGTFPVVRQSIIADCCTSSSITITGTADCGCFYLCSVAWSRVTTRKKLRRANKIWFDGRRIAVLVRSWHIEAAAILFHSGAISLIEKFDTSVNKVVERSLGDYHSQIGSHSWACPSIQKNGPHLRRWVRAKLGTPSEHN